jgi:predicted Zn finger-like uncharacterized protein
MIVTCEQCKTRFRLPDERADAPSVKVRCSRCKHTFSVNRTDLAAVVTAPVPISPQVPPTSTFTGIPLDLAPPSIPAVAPGAPAASFDPFSVFGSPQEAAADDLTQPARPQAEEPAPALDSLFGDPDAATANFSDDESESASGLELASPSAIPISVSRPEAARPQPARDSAPEASFEFDVGNDEASGPSHEPDRSFFSMPTSAASHTPEPAFERASEKGGLLSDIPDLAPSPEPVSAFDVPSPMMGRTTNPMFPAATLPPPPAPVEPTRAPIGRRTLVVRLVFGAGIAVVAATLLAVVLNGGSFPRSGLRRPADATGAVLSHNVVSGLYDTKTGRSVLFVRGEVENRDRANERMRVVVELWDGEQKTKTEEVLAGKVATPEELYAVGNAVETKALLESLGKESHPVGPGGRVPFLVAFYDYPADTSALAVQVKVTPERVEATRGAK